MHSHCNRSSSLSYNPRPDSFALSSVSATILKWQDRSKVYAHCTDNSTRHEEGDTGAHDYRALQCKAESALVHNSKVSEANLNFKPRQPS